MLLLYSQWITGYVDRELSLMRCILRLHVTGRARLTRLDLFYIWRPLQQKFNNVSFSGLYDLRYDKTSI